MTGHILWDIAIEKNGYGAQITGRVCYDEMTFNECNMDEFSGMKMGGKGGNGLCIIIGRRLEGVLSLVVNFKIACFAVICYFYQLLILNPETMVISILHV